MDCPGTGMVTVCYSAYIFTVRLLPLHGWSSFSYVVSRMETFIKVLGRVVHVYTHVTCVDLGASVVSFMCRVQG